MKINVVCDFLRLNEYQKRFDIAEKAVYLSSHPTLGNVFFSPQTIARDLGCDFDPISLDLCEIAAYVYLADKSVARGEFDRWARKLSFLIPVREPAKWNSVKGLLRNTIATLTGDTLQFHFVKRKESSERSKESRVPSRNKNKVADCVSLFSGGLDSFAGAVFLLEQGRSPIFVSHYVNAVLKNLQSNLIRQLEAKPHYALEHLQYRLTSKRVSNPAFAIKSRESSHRARSFLFMSFAAAVGALRGLDDLYICENGVLALNVPISDSRKGSRSTRHAHPLYLDYFRELIGILYGREFSVQNPFLFWTKSKEAAILKEKGFSSVIRETVSCWGYPNQTIRFKNSNHCGRCIPCVVRRVSVLASGLKTCDDLYAVDVFTLDGSNDHNQSRNFSDLFYFCDFIKSHTNDQLIYRYPEFLMIEAHRGTVSGDKIAKIISVYRQFADEVLAVAR